MKEETGITANIVRLLDVSEVIILVKPWHSITITYLGEFVNGELKSESGHPFGQKYPQWFSSEALRQVPISPIQKAMDMHLPER